MADLRHKQHIQLSNTHIHMMGDGTVSLCAFRPHVTAMLANLTANVEM